MGWREEDWVVALSLTSSVHITHIQNNNLHNLLFACCVLVYDAFVHLSFYEYDRKFLFCLLVVFLFVMHLFI